MNELLEENGLYRCARCGTVDTLSADGEAEAELAKNFPNDKPGDCDKVCEACYRVLLAEVCN